MAKAKKSKAAGKTKTKIVYRTKKAAKVVKRRARKAGNFLSKSGIGGAVGSMLPMMAGAMGAKLAQKKFGSQTEESGVWDWKDYLAGGVGVVAISLGSKYLFKASSSTSQKILEGGLAIMLFKALTQKLVPMNDTAQRYLGDDDYSEFGEDILSPGELGDIDALYGEDDDYMLPGSMDLNSDGNWQAQWNDSLNDDIVSTGPLGSSNETDEDAYANAFLPN